MRNIIVKRCSNCGTENYYKPYNVETNKTGHFYCNGTCKAAFTRKDVECVTILCSYCNRYFERAKARAGGTINLCSAKCSSVYFGQGFVIRKPYILQKRKIKEILDQVKERERKNEEELAMVELMKLSLKILDIEMEAKVSEVLKIRKEQYGTNK